MTETKEQWRQDFVHFWKYYIVPARASSSDLEFIKKKILEKGSGVRVLILGSTPEYRNLCGELGISVTCFDFSEYNYKYLTDEVKNKPQERFVNGNWFTHTLDEQFDIILGDVVINLQVKEKLPDLFRNIAEWLALGGLFMPRTYIRDKGETCTAEEAIRRYREKKGQSLYTGSVRELACKKDNHR
jgi:cyclopropane fatty-acyl-phospholipid synthase-like methyltransferase